MGGFEVVSGFGSVGVPKLVLALQANILVLFQVNRHLSQPYGWISTLLSFAFSPSTSSELYYIRKNLLDDSNDQALLAYRQSITDECNMMAVAVMRAHTMNLVLSSPLTLTGCKGAIIAQVAISALALPNLSMVHWLARACFLFAIVSGCLSVYYSCVLQRKIGKLYKPSLIRDFLQIIPGENPIINRSPSCAAVIVVSAPFNMIKFSILAFITGLAIYQGFIWTRKLDPISSENDSRAVFIFFMAGISLCIFFFEYSFLVKSIEAYARPKTGKSQRPLSWKHAEKAEPQHSSSTDSKTEKLQQGRSSEDPETGEAQHRFPKDSETRETQRRRFSKDPGTDETQHRRFSEDPETGTTQHRQSSEDPQIESRGVSRRDSLQTPSQLHPRQSIDGSHVGGLAAALEAAAIAHAQCAEADRRVAAVYEKINRAMMTENRNGVR